MPAPSWSTTTSLTGYSDPYYLLNINGTVYFSARSTQQRYELWKSDGTDAGTVLVKDINPGAAAPRRQLFTIVNGTLFFSADDGTNGWELWKSDGTDAGTVMVKDINLTGSAFVLSG